MIGAFLFLLSRSFVNRTKARLKRLKQPKYLIGAIFGLLYFYGYFFRFLFRHNQPGGPMIEGAGTVIGAVGSAILFGFVVSAWIFPHARAALVFTEAEIAFLFPAPVSRRTLLHYKLLKSQLAILFTVLLLTLFTGRMFSGSHAWMRVLGWWVILSTLNLHFLGASFVRTMLLERGVSNWLRRGLVALLLGGLVAWSVVWLRQTVLPPAIENFSDWASWRDYIQQLVQTPPLAYLLYPFQLVLRPYLAGSVGEFAQALPPALAVIGLHYLWVIRSNVAFEEASLEASRKFAEKLAAARQGKRIDSAPPKGRRSPFRLAPVGFAPVAFLWKNLISAQANFRVRTLVAFVIPLVVMGVMMGRLEAKGQITITVVSMAAAVFFFMSLLMGAQMVRCDFRHDAAMMDLLKLYPLRGWQVVAGELLAPLIILTVVQWLLLLLLAALVTAGQRTWHLPAPPFPWLLAAALLAPFWDALGLLIPNAAVLFFPGWFQPQAGAPQGIEVTGQRLLLVFGQFLIVGLTIIPAGLAFAVGFFPLHLAGLASMAPLAGAVAGAIILAGEVVLGVWLVGKLFDRFDLASEQAG